MRFLFLNQYFPPDPAPTGVLLAELADSLRSDGHTVSFTAARQNYRAGQRKRGRLLREMSALATMLNAGLRQPAADFVVSASSPPCLLLVATLVAARMRAKSIHWAMDLYPELAVSLGEVRQGFGIAGISKLMGLAYRRSDRVVALDADMARHLQRYRIEPDIIRPWVLRSTMDRHSALPVVPREPWTWIYSGNLGRAHEWETLLETQALLEERRASIRLVFQGGGPSWLVAQARAQQLGLRNCEWHPYATDEDLVPSLLRCHCLVVTQRPVTQGLLWPSKLALILALPRRVLWIGPEHGAIADELRTSRHAGIFAPGRCRDIAEWLVQMRLETREVVPAVNAHAHRSASLASWKTLIEEVVGARRSEVARATF